MRFPTSFSSVSGISPPESDFQISRLLIPKPLRHSGFQVSKLLKNTPAHEGDTRDVGSIPRLGRFPGGGHGNSAQYSCLENPMDRGAWWTIVPRVAQSQTQLKLLSLACHSPALLIDLLLSSPKLHWIGIIILISIFPCKETRLRKVELPKVM